MKEHYFEEITKLSYAGHVIDKLRVRIRAGNNIYLKDIYIYYRKTLFDIAKRITLSVRLPRGCRENISQKPQDTCLPPRQKKKAEKSLEIDLN